MQKNNWDILFDHVRFDFGIRGIIIYNGNAKMQRVYIAGYPYVRLAAQNDNEAKTDMEKDGIKILLSLIPRIYDIPK